MLESKFTLFRLKSSEWLFLFFALLLSLFFLVKNPPTTPPDEIAHLAYPRYILSNHSLPTFLTPEDAWESHQPPLYYLTSLPFVALSRASSFADQVTINRLTSVMFFMVYFYSLLVFLKKQFPENLSSRIVGMFLGLLPSILYISSSFANDISALAVSMILLTLWFTVRKATEIKTSLLFGILLGFALLTKAHVYPVVGILFLWFLIKKPWKHTFVTFCSMLLISGWWFLRNIFVVGDFFGLKNTFILWQGQDTGFSSFSTYINFFGKLAQGLIGIFAKNSLALPLWLYAFSFVLFSFLLFSNLKNKKISKNLNLTLLSCIAATLVFVFWQSTEFYQPQGRYLLPAYPFLLTLFLYGFDGLSRKIKTLMLITTVTCTSLLISFSITTLSKFEKTNSIPSFEHQRQINGLQFGWIGAKNRDKGEPLFFEIMKPVSTLADLRLLTERNPKIFIQTDEKMPLVIKLRWKQLGDNRFTDNKKMILTFTTETTVSFPKTEPTLIQDLELTLLEGTLPVALKKFMIITD